MDEPGGCASFFVAAGCLLAGAVLGALIGAPVGGVGPFGGAAILPWALVMGMFGWGAVSLPYLLVRIFWKSLPVASAPRAILGFVLVTPPAAAFGGWYLAYFEEASTALLVVEPVLFALVALPLAIVVGWFGRSGMWVFLAATAEVAQG